MKNTAAIVGLVLVVVLVLVLLVGVGMTGFGGHGMMGGYAGHRGMMGGMLSGYGVQGIGVNPFGAVLSLVAWALVIGGVVLLVVWLARNAGHAAVATSTGQAPLDILKTRYARGEITQEQFAAISKDLE